MKRTRGKPPLGTAADPAAGLAVSLIGSDVMRIRDVDQIFSDNCPLVRTRDQLSRALDRAVHQSYGAGTALRNAVVASTRELRTQGMSDPEALSVLGTLAEDVGRTSGGNRLDLVSGRPRWMLTRERVLKWATLELGRAQSR